MKRFVVIALISALASFSALGQVSDTKIEDKTPDEAAIRRLMENLAVAWNKHDAVSFSMVFAKDADFTNWRGTLRIHGREEIKNAHVDGFTGMFRQSKLTATDTHIRFFAPDVAAVHCEWELVGTIDYDGKGTMPPRKYFPLMIVTKGKRELDNCRLSQCLVSAAARGSYNRARQTINAGDGLAGPVSG